MTKFRVWCKNKKNWESHSVFVNQQGQAFHQHYASMALTFLKSETHTIEFFTGLQDKKGTDIYVGDILRFYISDHQNSVNNYSMNPKRWDFLVLYENSCFGYKCSIPELHHVDDLIFKPFFDVETNEIRDTKNIEIVGNIHENKDLLK